jgi:O-antigen/teichoic acid export membrane protein
MVLLNVWVARHVTPAVYGTFAIAVTSVLLLDAIVGAALDAAVIRTIGATLASEWTAAERAAIVAKVAAGAMLLAIALAAGTLGALPLVGVAVVGVISGIGLLVHRSALVYLQVRERFGLYAVVDLAHTLLRCGIVVALPSGAYVSAVAPLIAYAVAPWAVAAVVMATARGTASVRQWLVGPDDFASLGRVAAITLATTGVGAVVARIDLLLIGAAGAAGEAGTFAAASTLALVPTWIGAYIAPALSARIMPSCAAGTMQSLLSDVQRLVLVLAAAGTALAVAIAPPLVQRLLPAAYAPAVPVLRVLLVSGAAGFVTFPLVLHTLLFLSPRTYLVMDLVSLPVLVPLYVVAARRGGALGVAWVTAASSIVKSCVAQYVAVVVVRRADAAAAPLALAL